MSREGKSWLLLTGAVMSVSEVRFGGSNDVEDDIGK